MVAWAKFSGKGTESVVGADAGAFLGADGVGFETLVGDLDGVRHLLGGGAGEGSEETLDIDATVAELAVDRLVHGGEEFVAKLVEDLVDVDVGQKGSS